MTIAQIIAIICIGFEFCHLFYYYDIHKNIDDIVNLYNGAKVWEKAANNILKVNKFKQKNEYFNAFFPFSCDVNITKKDIKKISKNFQNSALSEYNKDHPNKIFNYLIYAFMEMVYWIISTVMCIMIGPLGLCILVGLFILSSVNSHIYNSDKSNNFKKGFNTVDCIICITTYLYIIFLL